MAREGTKAEIAQCARGQEGRGEGEAFHRSTRCNSRILRATSFCPFVTASVIWRFSRSCQVAVALQVADQQVAVAALAGR